jgi:hypothetical protein
MSYNHPLWAQQDLAAARTALERLAPTPEGRLAKAQTPKEKGYLEAVNQLFYAPGDKLARDNAYSSAMGRLYERWPDDHEIAIFYALALLGTVRPGDPQPSGRGALHHPFFRRSGPRDSSPAGGACLLEDCAGCATRPAYAVAHLRPARHVAGCGRLERGGL